MKFKILLMALIFYASSCTPKFSAPASSKTTTTWGATDAMYDKIILDTDKSYGAFSDAYVVINGEIDELVSIDASRKNARLSQKIIKDIKTRFSSYQDDHKAKGSMNNAEAKSRKNGMDVLWKSLYNTELNLNR